MHNVNNNLCPCMLLKLPEIEQIEAGDNISITMLSTLYGMLCRKCKAEVRKGADLQVAGALGLAHHRMA